MSAPNTAPAAIVWQRLSEMWSATSAEQAFVGPYELIAFDIPASGSIPRIVAWELHTGPKFATSVTGAPADSFDAAKAAAEQEVCRLLAASEGEHLPIPPICGVGISAGSTRLPSLGLTFMEAATRVRELTDAFNAVSSDAPDHVERRSAIDAEANRIDVALLSTQPQTPADAVAVLDILLDTDVGIPSGTMSGKEVGALALVRTFLATLIPGESGDRADDSLTAMCRAFSDADAGMGAQVQRINSSLDALEHPLTDAEGVADTLHLLAQSISDREVANPIAYLANQLALHLGDVRTSFTTALDQLQKAEAAE